LKAGNDYAAAERDAARPRSGEGEDRPRRAHGHDPVPADRERLGPGPRWVGREDPPAHQHEVGRERRRRPTRDLRLDVRHGRGQRQQRGAGERAP
jgi:hypothetical protein